MPLRWCPRCFVRAFCRGLDYFFDNISMLRSEHRKPAAPFQSVAISIEDPIGPAARQLIDALCAEMSERYGRPPSPFSLHESAVEKSVFIIARRDGEPVACGALRPFDEQHQYGISVRTWTGDMDGDKDIDLVQAEKDNPDGHIAWFENDGKGNWTRHIIRAEGQGQDFHSLAVADFDGDGDLDVYSGGGPISASKKFGSYIRENAGGKWIERVLSDKQCHEAEAADVDADGDIDICSKPWNGSNEHLFLRNMLVESRTKPAKP
jgi:hypothetical protein